MRSNFIEVGGSYTDRRGREWTCIAVVDDKAFCRNENASAAYSFALNGSPISLATSSDYTLNPQPVRDTVTFWGDCKNGWLERRYGGETHSITFTTLDGEPVCGSYTGPDGAVVMIAKSGGDA